MGGAAVIFIIILCVVILYVRQSHKKRSHELDNMMTEINSDVKMNTNPSYSIPEQSRKQEVQYDYVLHDKIFLKDDVQDTVIIKMGSNPSSGRVQAHDVTELEHDVIIQPNPSYSSISEETTKMSEDENKDGHVETNSQSTQREDYLKVIGSTTKEEESVSDNDSDETGSVKIDPNPSYEIASGGVKLEDNPSYNKLVH